MSDLTDTALSELAEALATRYEAGWIGVGIGTDEFDPTQTDLTGASKHRVQCEVVTVSGNSVTLKATFEEPDATFAWNELGVFLEGSGGPMLARKVLAGIGSKSPAQKWIAEAVVTFAHG